MALKIKPPTHRADALGVYISPRDTAWDNATWRADMAILEAKALADARDIAEAEHRAKYPSATAEALAEVRENCRLTEAQIAAYALWHPVVRYHRGLTRFQAAQGLHPVNRYARGVTRYQPNCDDWDAEGKPCTVRSRYLKEGATEFTLRRLPYAEYQAADAIENAGHRLTAFARAGLRAVKSAEFNWTAEDTDTRAPAHVIQVLHDADVSLPLDIGMAVIAFCRPPSDAETFR